MWRSRPTDASSPAAAGTTRAASGNSSRASPWLASRTRRTSARSCFEPSGQRLVTGCTFQEASEPFADLQSFDFKGARLVRYETPKGERHFWSGLLVISPDGRLLVAGCGGGTSASVGAGVWNLKTGRFLRLLTGWRIFGAFDAVFTSDGDFLLTSHIKGIRVWSTKTWKCVSVLEGGARMALTADERFIAYEKEKQVKVRPFVRPRGS